MIYIKTKKIYHMEGSFTLEIKSIYICIILKKYFCAFYTANFSCSMSQKLSKNEITTYEELWHHLHLINWILSGLEKAILLITQDHCQQQLNELLYLLAFWELSEFIIYTRI